MMSCDCTCPGYASFDGVRFSVLADANSGVYRDWGGMEPIFADEQIPYSNIVVREIIGYTPAVVTWRLQFGCRHQYHDFLARLGTSGTLVCLAGYQSLRGPTGSQRTLGNPPQVYEQLDGVTLMALPTREIYVDGFVEVDATFSRAFDPVTRLAVVEP